MDAMAIESLTHLSVLKINHFSEYVAQSHVLVRFQK